MKNILKAFGVIAFTSIIGFSFVTCNGGDNGGGEEEKPVLTLTFEQIGEWNDPDKQDWDRWQVFYQDESKSFNLSDALSKNKVYVFTYSFTSNIDVDRISAGFMHKKPDGSDWKDDITDYTEIATNVKKNTKFSGKVVISPKSGASGLMKENIYLRILIHNRNVSTPSTLSFYKFSLELADNENGNGSGTTPTITTASLPNGTVGTAYSQTLAATGDTPITWTIDGTGTLPTGLSLATTGTISGTPTTAGASTFTVKATNAAGYDTKSLSITIAADSSGEPTGWVSVGTLPYSSTINSITWGNNKFVVGTSGSKIGYSTDGIVWVTIDNPLSPASNSYVPVNSIAWGNNKFVAVGGNGLMAYSSDGITWQAVANSSFTTTINGITWGNNKFVAVGESGKTAYSTDGTTWTPVSSGYTPTLTNIAWGNNKFVAVGITGLILYSSDGTSWTKVEDSKMTSVFYGIAWGNNKFVAAGNNGKIVYSSDGVTWQEVANSTFDTTIKGIAWGNNKFVAVGYSGKVVYSSDGITWQAVADSTFSTSNINSIVWGNNKFVAVGATKIAYWNGN